MSTQTDYYRIAEAGPAFVSGISPLRGANGTAASVGLSARQIHPNGGYSLYVPPLEYVDGKAVPLPAGILEVTYNGIWSGRPAVIRDGRGNEVGHFIGLQPPMEFRQGQPGQPVKARATLRARALRSAK